VIAVQRRIIRGLRPGPRRLLAGSALTCALAALLPANHSLAEPSANCAGNAANQVQEILRLRNPDSPPPESGLDAMEMRFGLAVIMNDFFVYASDRRKAAALQPSLQQKSMDDLRKLRDSGAVDGTVCDILRVMRAYYAGEDVPAVAPPPELARASPNRAPPTRAQPQAPAEAKPREPKPQQPTRAAAPPQPARPQPAKPAQARAPETAPEARKPQARPQIAESKPEADAPEQTRPKAEEAPQAALAPAPAIPAKARPALSPPRPAAEPEPSVGASPRPMRPMRPIAGRSDATSPEPASAPPARRPAEQTVEARPAVEAAPPSPANSEPAAEPAAEPTAAADEPAASPGESEAEAPAEPIAPPRPSEPSEPSEPSVELAALGVGGNVARTPEPATSQENPAFVRAVNSTIDAINRLLSTPAYLTRADLRGGPGRTDREMRASRNKTIAAREEVIALLRALAADPQRHSAVRTALGKEGSARWERRMQILFEGGPGADQVTTALELWGTASH
jgi:hypothetical protein